MKWQGIHIYDIGMMLKVGNTMPGKNINFQQNKKYTHRKIERNTLTLLELEFILGSFFQKVLPILYSGKNSNRKL